METTAASDKAQETMMLRINLAVNGNLQLVDADDDDSPIATVHFANEAGQLSDGSKVRLGQMLIGKLREEMVEAGILIR